LREKIRINAGSRARRSVIIFTLLNNHFRSRNDSSFFMSRLNEHQKLLPAFMKFFVVLKHEILVQQTIEQLVQRHLLLRFIQASRRWIDINSIKVSWVDMDKEGPEYLVEIVEFFHDCFPIFFCFKPFIDGVAQEICDRLKY
jgi:hypothetical protein